MLRARLGQEPIAVHSCVPERISKEKDIGEASSVRQARSIMGYLVGDGALRVQDSGIDRIKLTIMNTLTLLLASALLASPEAPLARNMEGGPPAIRIAGKSGGDITAAQWNSAKAVDLVGCVPGARIVSLRLCVRDCKGKDAGLSAKEPTLTESMKAMISDLPVGTRFRVEVVVSDRSGKSWDVPDAEFVWKG